MGLDPGARKLGSGAGATTASAGREKDIEGEIARLDAEYASANPNATKAEKDKAHFANRQAAEKGIASATTKEARSPGGMFMRKFLADHQDATPQEISRAAAGYTRDQAIERNFAGGTGANQMRSLNTVADHLKLMREYASALSVSDIPRANAVFQSLMTNLGHPEVTNFEAGRDIFADEVVRLLTSTGGTEADRAGMQSRFRAAASPDQMAGVLDVAERFVAGRFKGLEQGYARNDAARRREFEQEMLTPEAREIFTKHGTGAGGATTGPQPTQDAVPVPPGAAGDPDGTSYEKDGVMWVKRGNQIVKTPGAVRTQ